MEDYLQHYGWHFSKKAAEYAASKMMRKSRGSSELEPVQPMTREQVDQLLDKFKIKLEYDELYDAVYVANMAKADMMENDMPAIDDDHHLAKYIKCVVDDPDADDGEIFAVWVMKMHAKGVPIDWERML